MNATNPPVTPSSLPTRSASLGLRTDDPFFRAIGGTPLLPLTRIVDSVGGGFEILAKAEFLNPTGSVKDRAALAIVASRDRGGCARRRANATSMPRAATPGCRTRCWGPASDSRSSSFCHGTQARTGSKRIRALGARIVFTDPLEGTDGAQREARRRASAEPSSYYYPDQYNNAANPDAHYATTGPEIWHQSRERVTHFVAGVGTGGTITGTARYLKERRPSLEVIGVEPVGPIHGLEGLKHLPTARRPSTYDARVVDRTLRVETEDAAAMQVRLVREEGLEVGMSAAAAVVAAVLVGRVAPGAVIATILPDGGQAPSEEDC